MGATAYSGLSDRQVLFEQNIFPPRWQRILTAETLDSLRGGDRLSSRWQEFLVCLFCDNGCAKCDSRKGEFDALLH